MKISIEPETPEEIQQFKPVNFHGLQSMVTLGIVRDETGARQCLYSMYGNTKDVLEQLAEATFQVTLTLKKAQAAQQPLIQVPKLKFRGTDGRAIE